MMTKRVIIYLCLILAPLVGWAQGIPLMRNYTSEEYGAHNRNYDILTKNDGTVYVANFEGLLYYDQAEWHILHTPNITNLTTLYLDHNNTVWTGGYNFFGRLEVKDNGQLALVRVGKSDLFSGEVQRIWEEDGQLLFQLSDGALYQVKDGKVSNVQGAEVLGQAKKHTDVIQTEQVDDGFMVEVIQGEGLVVSQKKTGKRYTVTEANGLCSNNVAKIAYDGHGLVWGATANGIFCLAIPSAFSHFTDHEGLAGEVLSITDFQGKKYIGTIDGLFYQDGIQSFTKLRNLPYACWELVDNDKELLVATANGIYALSADGQISERSSTNCTAIYRDSDGLYTGEADGLWLQQAGSAREKVCNLPLVIRIMKDGKGTLWLQNAYGQIWNKTASAPAFSPYGQTQTAENAATIVKIGDNVVVIDAKTEEPFPYPLFSQADASGITWLTDNEGKNLYAWRNGEKEAPMSGLLKAVRETVVRAIYYKDRELWIGNQYGVTIINSNVEDQTLRAKPKLRFCSIKLNGDSILWGGFTDQPVLDLSSRDRNLSFTYALDVTPLVGNTLYRYRMNDNRWSAWTTEQMTRFNNLYYGSYTLSVQAMLANGELTDAVELQFDIAYPIYMSWYAWLLYLALALLIVFMIFHLRTINLEKEKQKLEKIVRQRTEEVVSQRDEIIKQKDEIQEKSQSLENALHELNTAQKELIRSEKMATVGKLTQGLVDRILNPINYITNFSKLSEGLVNDIRKNVEEEKDAIADDNYDDTMDVLGMLESNLQQVDKHGQNTTRVLKAMDEILKDRRTGFTQMDLTPVLRQCEETFCTKHTEEIRLHGITISFDIPEIPIQIDGNGGQLSKTITYMLDNSIYAIIRKDNHNHYDGKLTLKANMEDNKVRITIWDNGIGIEENIQDKIFDPFFTTKTTSEATGIGLYISREIIQNHHGDIAFQSKKNEFTEFTITLPLASL